MTKRVVSRLFIGSMLAVFAGFVLGLAAITVAFGGGAFVMRGPDVVGVNSSPFAWSMIVLTLIGILAICVGAIGGLVAWIAALLNTVQLDDKAWFVLILVLGLLSFGLAAMIAYVIAAPDALGERPATAPRQAAHA